MKLKWGTAGRLRRGAVVLGVVGLAAGAAVASAGSALAANGSEPGHLTLSPASGPATTQPTWSTSDACPTGFQGSAVVVEFNTDGTLASRISNVIPSPAAPIVNATLLDTVGNLLTSTNLPASGGTVEWAVACFSAVGGTGSSEYVQSTDVTLTSAGQYSTGVVTQTATSTSLSTTPSGTAQTGQSVTLTATEVAADSTHPAGNVQFQVGGTNINSPVAVNASGVATTTTTFSAPGTEALSAVFTPTSNTYAGSTGSTSLSVQQAGSLTATGSPVPITVTVAPTGTLSVSVVNATVPLTLNAAGTQATGTLGTVTINDSRNTFPGWSVTGTQSNFTEAAPGTATINGDEMGWVPGVVGSLVGGALLGPTVAPGTSPGGLGDTGATLISATPGNGFGINNANAALTLDIPSGTPPGAYAGSMAITYLSVGP